mmetsp:Transcript_36505/g.113795  ORF Transcript_36505/g.113795 Transcript_36505/m.113795 type:complete len:258 (+) Transcript_36505:182-955(+)
MPLGVEGHIAVAVNDPLHLRPQGIEDAHLRPPPAALEEQLQVGEADVELLEGLGHLAQRVVRGVPEARHGVPLALGQGVAHLVQETHVVVVGLGQALQLLRAVAAQRPVLTRGALLPSKLRAQAGAAVELRARGVHEAPRAVVLAHVDVDAKVVVDLLEEVRAEGLADPVPVPRDLVRRQPALAGGRVELVCHPALGHAAFVRPLPVPALARTGAPRSAAGLQEARRTNAADGSQCQDDLQEQPPHHFARKRRIWWG